MDVSELKINLAFPILPLYHSVTNLAGDIIIKWPIYVIGDFITLLTINTRHSLQ